MPDVPAPAATAARAILDGQVRHVLTLIAGAAIAHGVATEAQTGALVPALTETLTGAIIAGLTMAWSWGSARLSHGRFAAAWAVLNGGKAPDQVLPASPLVVPMPQVAAPLSNAGDGQAVSAGPIA